MNPAPKKSWSSLLPWMALIISLSATLIAWRYEENISQQELEDKFSRMALQAKAAIQNHLTEDEQALLGAKGLIEASGGATRIQWREYVGALKIGETLSGIQGIGLAVRVTASDKARHEEKIRNEGFPKYGITPPGDRAEYYPIIYLEPLDWRNQRALGYDMFSEPVRREAMERSRRHGVTTISGKTLLVQETEKDRQNGFLMYVPVYAKGAATATQAERERAHTGFAYAPFRMNNFMKGALEGERHWLANPDWLDIEIYDGREQRDETMLFDSAPEHIYQAGDMAKVMTVDMYGHAWTVRCNPKPDFIRAMRKGKSELVLAGGLLLSLLIFGITWALGNTRRRAENLAHDMNGELRRSMTDARALLDAAQESMFLMEVGGKVISINETAATRFGKRPDELVGRNIYDFMPPELAAARKEREAEVVRTRSSTTIEDERLGRLTQATLWPVVDSQTGEVVRIAAFAIDITERKKGDKTLRETRQILDSIVENIPAMVFVKRAGDLRFELFNRAGEELLGYSRNDLIGKCDYDFFTKEQGDWFTAADRKALASREITDIPEEPIKIASGETRYLHTMKIALRDEAGEPSHLLGISIDITARKKAEDALRDSEERYRSLVDASPVCIHEIDMEGRIASMNNAGLLMMCASDENEVKGLVYLNAVCAEDRTRIGKLLDRAFAGESSHFEFKSSGQREQIFKSCFVPIMNQKGDVEKLMGITEDITDFKQATEKLRFAKEQAEAATDLKDKFVYLVAHDLRSPFTAIIGLLEILENDQNSTLSASQREIVSLILDSGKTQLKMIDNLLTLSRLQTDKITPRKKFLDTWGLVQGAIDPLIHLARQKDVAITNQAPHNSWLYADPDLFHGVIHNLISNAIKFCRKGDNITVYQPAGQPATLIVRDTGVGVDASILSHLFDNEIKTTTRGTMGERGSGFGLPLASNIMEAHGGSISAENLPEGGSAFTVKTPYLQPLILMVDDEEASRTILSHLLIGLSVNVMGAGSVDAAIELIRKNRPSLVISDIQMPGKNGFELLTWIKKNVKGLPVMMLTMDSSMATREEAFRLGANDFVTKPVNKSDLVPRARNLILEGEAAP